MATPKSQLNSSSKFVLIFILSPFSAADNFVSVKDMLYEAARCSNFDR